MFLLCGQLISHYSRNASAKAGGKPFFIKKRSIVNIVAKLQKLGILMRKKMKNCARG